jgi:hypothetical protein
LYFASCRVSNVAACLEVPCNPRLERQAYAAIPQPAAEWPPFLIERNSASPGRMHARAIQRSSVATSPGLFSRGTSIVAGSVGVLDRSSTISTASAVSRKYPSLPLPSWEIEGARLRLAEAMLSVATEGSTDVAALKAGALQAMAMHYR